MQGVILVVAIAFVIYFAYQSFGSKPQSPFEKAMMHTRRHESIRAEVTMNAAVKEAEAKYGADAIQTIEAKAGLGVVLSRGGEAADGVKLLDETRPKLIEAKSAMLPIVLAHKALIQKANSTNLPAFIGLFDSLDDGTVVAALKEAVTLATETSPDLGRAYLLDVRAQADRIHNQELIDLCTPAFDQIAAHQAELAEAIARAQAAQAQGQGKNCGGNCGSCH